ncbi:MAG: L,D-transpeptidase [Sulfobacillus thermotolerans]|nr:L,D-transpeptidase [Sulfobacillus thermotolerans]
MRRYCIIRYRQFKFALFAAVIFVWTISLSLNRLNPSVHDTADAPAYFTPQTHSPVGIDYGVQLETDHPEARAILLEDLHVHPTLAFHVTATTPTDYTLMPDRFWPAHSIITVSFHQGQFHTTTTFATGDAHILRVNLTDQTLEAYEGSTRVRIMPVSTGVSPQWTTPTGTFWIYKRVVDDHMVGGIPGTKDYWDVEHVPYAQYIFRGIAIHGAWWNHHFGVPKSHGCIQLSTEGVNNARWVWDFSAVGTPVIVFGHTPKALGNPVPYPKE